MKKGRLTLNVYSLFVVITLVLTGCGKQAAKVIENTSLTVCEGDTGKVYILDYQDAHITPDYKPLSTAFPVTEKSLYFVDTTDALEQSICEVSFQNSDTPAKLPIDIGGASVKALAADRTKAENSTIYCMAMNLPENGFLAAFSQDGEELWRTEFSDSLNQSMQENEVFRLIQDGEGRFYALSMQWIFLFDSTGAYQGEIECPGKSFLGISPCGEEKVYASYQSDTGQQPFLAEVQFQSKRLTEKTQVCGNGSLYKGVGNTLLLHDSSAVYSCEPDSGKAVKLLDLADYDILGNRIQSMVQTAEGEIIIISWELLNQNSPVEVIKLSEAAEETSFDEGKQIITFLCMRSMSDVEWGYGAIVADFNKQSKDYKVVLEEVDYATIDDLYTAINTRLVAKESVDLLEIIDYEDIERLQSKGFLEDLTPYLEQSETIKKEYYIEEVLRCLEINEKLYGMAEVFTIDTLMGRASELGDRPGWTVDEFLNWLKQHPKTKGELGLSKELILEYCLKGNLNAYVDWNQGKALFEEATFNELLTTIQGLDTDDNMYYNDWQQILNQGDSVLEQKYVGDFSYSQSAEIWYQDEEVYKGYPSEDGAPKYFFDMGCLSILSRSSCKEGAFAFLEYYMMHKKFADTTYYTQKADYEASKKSAMESETILNYGTAAEERIPQLTEAQLERQMELFKYAVPDSLSAQTVRQIILEEAQAYFQGGKALDDTCRIIQSRVQLYLDENQ